MRSWLGKQGIFFWSPFSKLERRNWDRKETETNAIKDNSEKTSLMTLELDVLILPVQTAGTVKDFRGLSSVPRSACIMVCPRGEWTWGML